MNRTGRRANVAGTKPLPGASPALTQAEGHYRGGRLAEAETLCDRILLDDPGDARALALRGLVAQRQGRPVEALACLTRALPLAPRVAAIHDGLAEAYRATGQRRQAERHYQHVASLRPGAVPFLNLGHARMDLQRPKDAAEAYKSALRHDPGSADAYYGLGAALAALGILEAGDAFGRAAALRPDFAAAHEGLIEVCSRVGAWGAALQACSAALLRCDTPRLRMQFVDAVVNVDLVAEVPGLRAAIERALAERWTRPSDLARAACDIAMLRQPCEADDPLIATLLDLAPVCHKEVERLLTARRRTLLKRVAEGEILGGKSLDGACRLARQCFVNEYAWAVTPPDAEAVGAVRRQVEADLACCALPAPARLAVLAMFQPLSTLDGAERLKALDGDAGLAALLAQQVSEPAKEARLRGTLPAATDIDDAVSVRVREQYEANPYPRWVAVAASVTPVRLDAWLAGRFPGAPVAAAPRDRGLDVLVAGCGTGQQAIETARGFADARVLAIDLSRASLAYAARMTEALGMAGTPGLAGIDYAQADLLRLASLGRSFDLIASGGVLHHMADPWVGWRALLACLRPGGAMNVLLYTERGRGDARAARDWIAARGDPDTQEGIRACRQALMQAPEAWAARLAASPDFNSISGCRDLLFHVHEQAVTLPAINAFLAAENLALLGVEVSPATGQAFQAWSRDRGEAAQRDLAQWDLFEAEHPRCFAGMINLWVRKERPADMGLGGANEASVARA